MSTYSLLQSAKLVGQTVLVRFENIQVQCKVQDMKYTYGRTRFLISPTNGDDEQWVEENRVSGIEL